MPSSEWVHHKIASNVNSSIQWTIVNNIGQEVKEGTELPLEKGENYFTIDVSDLMPGMYFVKYQMYGFYRIKPLIVK